MTLMEIFLICSIVINIVLLVEVITLNDKLLTQWLESLDLKDKE